MNLRPLYSLTGLQGSFSVWVVEVPFAMRGPMCPDAPPWSLCGRVASEPRLSTFGLPFEIRLQVGRRKPKPPGSAADPYHWKRERSLASLVVDPAFRDSQPFGYFADCQEFSDCALSSRCLFVHVVSLWVFFFLVNRQKHVFFMHELSLTGRT